MSPDMVEFLNTCDQLHLRPYASRDQKNIMLIYDDIVPDKGHLEHIMSLVPDIKVSIIAMKKIQPILDSYEGIITLLSQRLKGAEDFIKTKLNAVEEQPEEFPSVVVPDSTPVKGVTQDDVTDLKILLGECESIDDFLNKI